jgi:hypothetical protein
MFHAISASVVLCPFDTIGVAATEIDRIESA